MSWKGLPNNCTKQNDKNIKCQQQQKCDFMKIYTKRDEKTPEKPNKRQPQFLRRRSAKKNCDAKF